MYLTLIAQNQFANDQISTLGNFYVGTYLKYQNLKLIFVPINMISYCVSLAYALTSSTIWMSSSEVMGLGLDYTMTFFF